MMFRLPRYLFIFEALLRLSPFDRGKRNVIYYLLGDGLLM